MLLLVYLFSAVLQIPCNLGQRPPGNLPIGWFRWGEDLMTLRLIEMTRELVKDATYKLKHAEKIRDKHRHTITYELGTIAAGIQERFQRMLKIYRKHADLKGFEHHKYGVVELMNAYHVIQGDYNEIRLEKGIFHDIVRKHESTPSTSRYRIPADIMKQFSTYSPKRRLWSPNTDY